jgi:hypothetical protein
VFMFVMFGLSAIIIEFDAYPGSNELFVALTEGAPSCSEDIGIISGMRDLRNMDDVYPPR